MPRVTRRLIVGLAVSVVIHLMIVMGFNPRSARFVPPLPLEVEIRREVPPQPATEFATGQPSELSAPPADLAAPPEPVPQEAPASASAAPPTPFELGLPLDKYYTARELDVRAEQTNEVHLVYPERAYVMRVSGKVLLRILINEHGAIDNVAIVQAAPPGAFEEAALTATRALQFKPAIKNGRNVKSQKTIEVVFDPYESINIP